MRKTLSYPRFDKYAVYNYNSLYSSFLKMGLIFSPDIGVWCNGSTQNFGFCDMGSNPVTPAKIKRKGVTAWTIIVISRKRK